MTFEGLYQHKLFYDSVIQYGKPEKFSSARNTNFTLLSGAF